MGCTRRLIAIIVGTLTVSGFAATVSIAADAPGKSAPANAGKPDAAGAAKKPVSLAPQIAALQKEWQAYAKDPKSNKIREKCDYFKENPAPDLTPEAVLKALEGSVSGGPGAEAYVKWQLLSGVGGKFPDELLKRAIAVYRRAPAPASHPGLNRRELNRAINGKKKAEAASYQEEMSEAVENLKSRNEVFLEYRDALFARLPNKLEAYQSGLEDAADRASRGLNANSIFDTVSTGLRGWAITDAKPGQVAGVVGAVRRLREVVTRDDSRPYARIGDDKGMARWDVGPHAIDPKKIDDLVQFLENNASGGMGGGLKFKDSKEK
jgi:hypothetical protein